MRDTLTILLAGLFSKKLLLFICLLLASAIAYIFFYTDTFSPIQSLETNTPTKDVNSPLTKEEVIKERVTLPTALPKQNKDIVTELVTDVNAVKSTARNEVFEQTSKEEILQEELEAMQNEAPAIVDVPEIPVQQGSGMKVGTVIIEDELSLVPAIDVEVSGTIIDISVEERKILIQNEDSVLKVSVDDTTQFTLQGKKILLNDVEVFDIVTVLGSSHPQSTEVTAKNVAITSKFEPGFKEEI